MWSTEYFVHLHSLLTNLIPHASTFAPKNPASMTTTTTMCKQQSVCLRLVRWYRTTSKAKHIIFSCIPEHDLCAAHEMKLLSSVGTDLLPTARRWPHNAAEQMLIVVLPGAFPLLRLLLVEKGNASEFYLMQFAKCKTLVRVNHGKSSNKFEPG